MVIYIDLTRTFSPKNENQHKITNKVSTLTVQEKVKQSNKGEF